jgi:hypothetical protein
MNFKKKLKAQEEMLGFGLIVIIIAIIILIFISFYIKKDSKPDIESYEVEGFIQASLQHTTNYKNNLKYFSLRELIIQCYNNENCDLLNKTLNEIMEKSWLIRDNSVQGYDLKIKSPEKEIINLEKGNFTQNYKGALQDLGKNDIMFNLKIYY